MNIVLTILTHWNSILFYRECEETNQKINNEIGCMCNKLIKNKIRKSKYYMEIQDQGDFKLFRSNDLIN